LTSPLAKPRQDITGSFVRIEIIRTTDQWAALAAEWNALLSQSHVNVPFLTFEFQRAWWDHLGGGEWKNGELNILVGRNENGDLIGIAPLFSTKNENGKVLLQFIGSHEIADYLDLIVRREEHALFTLAVIDTLNSLDTNWDRVELYNLIDSSATLPIFKLEAGKAELRVEIVQPSPYIDVPATFEDYLGLLDSKQAHELRRKLRRAERNPSPISLEIVKDPSQLEAGLEDFFRLMCQEEDKAKFLTPEMRGQMKAIAQAAFKAGWLQLAFLKSGAVRIAGYMNFDYDNCIWAYNAGFDNEYANLSPGWLILAELMKWAIENKRRVFDFMRGGEEYKYRFGGKNRYVKEIVISR
jgi:CelD/BcsL family acetyltransferase involved in cellulose biosynthesis